MSKVKRYWENEYEYKRILEILDDYWLTSKDEILVTVEMQFLKSGHEFQKKRIIWRNPNHKISSVSDRKLELVNLEECKEQTLSNYFDEVAKELAKNECREKEEKNTMEDIVWFNKEKGGNYGKKEDVSIKKLKAGVSIIIRNGLDEEITTTNYVRIGFSNENRTRLYFMGAQPNTGWKFSRSNKNSSTVTIAIRDDRLVSGLLKFEGDYNLEISEDNLFFIDRKNVVG